MVKPTSIKLDDALKHRVHDLAEQRQRPVHWILREAIERYVTHKEARERFRQKALASWQHYQRTGLHLRGQEVSAWLKTWGTDDETPGPKFYG